MPIVSSSTVRRRPSRLLPLAAALVAALPLLGSCRSGGGSGGSAPMVAAPDRVLSCPAARDSVPNQWIAFRRDVVLSKVPASVTAVVSADSKYWLWINGRMAVFEGCLKRGPNPRDGYYDSIDIAPYLRTGSNSIAVLLWYFGKTGFSHNDTGRPQLFFAAPDIGVGVDDLWLARVHPAYGTADGLPAPNYRLPESSIRFDAREDIPGWQEAEAPAGFAAAALSPGSLGDLHPRPVPMWRDYGVKEVPFESEPLDDGGTRVVARLPHNMQMTPVLTVSDPEGGHRVVIETDHAKVGEECLRAEYVTRPGDQTYESLGWLSGMRIILTLGKGAELTGLAYRETGYDTVPEGTFSCSDPFFEKLWAKGLRTIYVNARDTFFDCPDRERGQWWGDIVTISGEIFYTFSTSLHAIVGKGLRELAGHQSEDGSLSSPIPGSYGVELPCQMLAAVGKYGAWNYYMNTGDKATVEAVYPAFSRYVDQYRTGPDGLVEYRVAGWNWGDWGPEKDMVLLQNMWYCLALEGVADMAELLGRDADAKRYRDSRETLLRAIDKVCWTEDGYRHPAYAGCTDDRVQALAVLAGVAPRERHPRIRELLHEHVHASPYMEKYVMEALFALGDGGFALGRIRDRYRFMVEYPDTDTLYENWDVGVAGDWHCGSVNHAWTGGPLSVIPSRMLGVVPLEAGWRRFSVAPDKCTFGEVSLGFPTVSGTVAVSLRRAAGSVEMDVQVPSGTTALVSLPWDFSSAKVDARPAGGREFPLGPGRHAILVEGVR